MQNKEQQAADLIREVIKLINEDFSNPDMSLSDLSLHFGLSEKRITNLLRDTTGMTFQSYLESRRMEEANRLLTEGKLSVILNIQMKQDITHSLPVIL